MTFYGIIVETYAINRSLRRKLGTNKANGMVAETRNYIIRNLHCVDEKCRSCSVKISWRFLGGNYNYKFYNE